MSRSSTNPASRTLAVVFSRLGPYHFARLRGAAEALGAESVVLAAISIAGSDRVYAWEPVQTDAVHPLHVLFPQKRYEDLSALALTRTLQASLDEINPMAVALPGWAFVEARAGLAWCRRNNRPAILMSESSRGDHFRLWPREMMKQRLVRRFGAALVGGSRHRDYARQLGIPRAAIFDGYDVVDNEHFAAGAERARRNAGAIRRERGLPARYLLASSRFVAKKNIDGLLRAYARYVETTPGSRDLVLCGDGELKDRLQRLARALSLNGRVHWPGFVQYPDLPVYYGLADAFVLASTTEQWGLVVNEAMASGLPVLVSRRCGCAPDLVREGVNGFTFDPEDRDELVSALRRVPEEPAELARMGEASRSIIASYDVTAFGNGLLSAARMVLSRLGREDLGEGRRA